MNRCSRGSLARDCVAFFVRTTLRERTLLCKRNIAPKKMAGRVVDVAAAPAADIITINNFNTVTTSFPKLKSDRRF